MANIQVMDNKAVIEFDCLGTPTHYRISDNINFTGSTWTTFPNSQLQIKYPLSEIKTYNLFGQVKNDVMESNIRTLTIDRLDDYVAINLKVIVIDNGNTGTTSNTVGVILQYDGIPTQYKYALNPNLVNGAVEWSSYTWNDYSSFPSSFYIGGSDGVKNFYFLLKDSRDATSEKHNSILYNEPVAPTLTGANYITPYSGETLTVTPIYTGLATQYSSEKLGDTPIWKSFNGTSFDITLSEIGDNTFTLKLKNIYGESTGYNYTVNFAPPAFNLESVLINSGDTGTTTNTVSVHLNKIGYGTASLMRYALTAEGITGATWVTYNSTFDYTFTDAIPDSTLTLYVQIQDTIGTLSSIQSDSIYYISVAKPTAYIKDVDGNYGLIDYGFVKLSRSSSVSGDNNCNFYDQDGNVMGRLGRIAQADMPINANSVQFQVYNDWLNRDYPGDSNCFFHHRDFYQNIIIARDYSGNKVLATGYKLYNLTPGSYTVEIWDMTIKVEAYGETAKWIINGVEYQAPQSIRYTNNGAVGVEPEYVTHNITVDSSGIITIVGCLNGGTYPDSSNYITPGWGVIKLIKN